MTVAFVRQIGFQPGVQLNPLKDGTDGFAPDNSDQVFAIAMRAKRGRIDRCFRVDRGTFERKLGFGESIRANVLNEAHVQVFEALKVGASAAVVHRLVTADAELNYIVATKAAGGGGTAAPAAGDIVYSVAAELPGTYVFALKHLECFNDGVTVETHADAMQVADVDAPASVVTIRVRAPNGDLLFEVTGSFDPTAIDGFNRSFFIGDVLEAQQEVPDLEIEVAPGATISPGTNAYGRALNGTEKTAKSAVLSYFTEGGFAYTAADYIKARERLTATRFDYSYVASGGSQSPALLLQLAQLAFDVNKLPSFDIDGSLSPAAAIAFVKQLGLDTHYVKVYWAPLRGDDPVNGGKAVIGCSGNNIGQACLRNADRNNLGFAKKNQPIGGKNYPVQRSGLRQIYDPTETELSDLARAKINPVLFESYNGGGAYVFTDVLTLANTEVSARKLASVAEMASSMDDIITKYAKEVLILPMKTAVAKTKEFLKVLFENAQSSDWITPTPELKGAAFAFIVQPNAQKPVDRMDITYSLHYDGVARVITVSQTLSK